tara:strand:+ start:316 stop:1413 length:1098 start_codon:yes stop_codon:yes gene_type:complete
LQACLPELTNGVEARPLPKVVKASIDNPFNISKLILLRSGMQRVTIFLLAVMIAMNVKAELSAPFTASNINPFVQLHGLPSSRAAKLVPNKALVWQFQTDIANNFTESTDRFESIRIDGETYRANLSLRYGFGGKWEVGIDVPYIRHGPGQLDAFIEGFHDLFGLSQANRGDRPRNRLNYTYDSGVNALHLNKSVSGIGEVRLNLGYKLRDNDTRTWSVRGGVKLPTGDPGKLTGSGGTDVFVGLYFSQSAFLGNESLSFHGSLGALSMGNGELVGIDVEELAIYGSSILAWRIFPNFSLKAQFDFHSALYESELKEIGSFGGQLVLGGSVTLGRKTQLDLSVSEDVIVSTAPDVVFSIGLRSTF